MGAQTAARAEQFRKRYEEWEDESGQVPPFHYGTHYSSAAAVSSYLLRLAPFTECHRALQVRPSAALPPRCRRAAAALTPPPHMHNIVALASTWQDGRFDLADRLFHSVSEEWGLASGERGSDTGCVKARKPSPHPIPASPVPSQHAVMRRRGVRRRKCGP